MKQIVRGDTPTQLNEKVKEREGRHWKRLTENTLDDTKYNISWVCVMELQNDQPDKKRKWGYFK